MLQIKAKVLGADHEDTLTHLVSLAQCYMRQQRWKLAAELLTHVVEVRIKSPGYDNPETLSVMQKLSAALWELGA